MGIRVNRKTTLACRARNVAGYFSQTDMMSETDLTIQEFKTLVKSGTLPERKHQYNGSRRLYYNQKERQKILSTVARIMGQSE